MCIENDADLTLKEFTLRCAKAFNACIMQREDDLAVPTLNVCSTYHSDEMLKAQNKLLELEGLSSENKRLLWEAHTKEVSARNAMYRHEYDENVERYDRMQIFVQKWGPPTQDHGELKKFMLDQIKIGRPHGTL